MTVLERNEQLVIDRDRCRRGRRPSGRDPWSGVREDFRGRRPWLGWPMLTERLEPYRRRLVVVEPTAGTWLPLTMAVTDAGCRIGFVQNRDSARLRKAITGPNKTDLIDADMLAHCESVLGVVEDAPVPPAGQIGLRRALRRRHRLTVDRPSGRVPACGRWPPGPSPTCGGPVAATRVAQPVLGRWPDLRALGRARSTRSPRSSPPTAGTATRPGGPNGSGPRPRAGTSSGSAVSTSTTSPGKSQNVDDIAVADAAHRDATDRALGRWRQLWPNDVLTSVLGVGPICASTTRAWWGDGTHLRSAKAAGAFIGLNPSNWESGLSASPSRSITKQGPAVMRLAYYQAANVARRRDPTRRPLPQAHVRTRPHPHPSQLCGRPQTRRPHLGRSPDRRALRTPRPRRPPHQRTNRRRAPADSTSPRHRRRTAPRPPAALDSTPR